MKQLHEIVNRL